MDPAREREVLRMFAKDVIREEGLDFEKNLTQRDIGREVKELNNEYKLSSPLTVAEFSELYLEIMKELVAERFAKIEEQVSSARNQHSSRMTPSDKSGQATTACSPMAPNGTFE